MIKNDCFLKLDWKKNNGMIPVIIQNYISGEVLMHAYMNRSALSKTKKEGVVTFYSRSKKRLWTKGEVSKNYLKVISIAIDCDQDTILIVVNPMGDTCHLNKNSCFSNYIKPDYTFLYDLDQLLKRKKDNENNISYTDNLYQIGIQRIAQKVGEEAIETVLASVGPSKKELIDEASDLIYHLLVLLNSKNLNFNDIINNLRKRNKK